MEEQVKLKLLKRSKSMEHTIESLVDLSKKRNFGIDDLPWHLGVDHSLKWMPDSLNPLTYLPSYNKLPKDEQLKLGQYYATGICEKFIFFESSLCISLEVLLSKPKKLPKRILPLMEIFCEEEAKHSAMFKKLQNEALPEKYKGEEQYFINQGVGYWLSNNLIFKNPEFFIFWLWLGAYFEEKTVVFSQEYIKHRKSLDPLFYQIHRFHLQDEARHVEIDRHFFKAFYDKSSNLKKKMAFKMFNRTLKSIEIPIRTVGKIFHEIQNDMQVQDVKLYDQLFKEMDLLNENEEYKRTLFGKKRFPVFHSILEDNPDFVLINEHFYE